LHRIDNLLHKGGAIQRNATDLVTFIRRVDDRLAHIESDLADLNRKATTEMALTQAESDAFTKLGTDIGAWKTDLQSKVDALTASAAALQSSESADQATIKDLNDQIAQLKTSVDNTPDVVSAINTLDSQVNPPAAAQTSTGPLRTGTEPAVPGGSPAPENPAQAPDATTVPGGTASVTTDLNAPSQQNVTDGSAPASTATAPDVAAPPPGTTSAAAQSETPGSVAVTGGPVSSATTSSTDASVGSDAPASTSGSSSVA